MRECVCVCDDFVSKEMHNKLSVNKLRYEREREKAKPFAKIYESNVCVTLFICNTVVIGVPLKTAKKRKEKKNKYKHLQQISRHFEL